jgi:hypothetical protein
MGDCYIWANQNPYYFDLGRTPFMMRSMTPSTTSSTEQSEAMTLCSMAVIKMGPKYAGCDGIWIPQGTQGPVG